MTDIRDLLNERREALRPKLARARELVDGEISPSTEPYRDAQRIIEEALEIESILAQMQTTDAQNAVARGQELLASAQREATDAQLRATASSERDRAWSEGQAFWLRRFFTSVAVANGAGAFASVTALLRPDPPEVGIGQAQLIISCFGLGLVIAGLLPLLLAARPTIDFTKRPWPLSQTVTVSGTAASTLLLLIGCVMVVQVAFATLQTNKAQLAAAAAPAAHSQAQPSRQPAAEERLSTSNLANGATAAKR